MPTPPPLPTLLDADLASARQLLAQGRAEDAERSYRAILDRAPDQLEALNFLALRALRGGDRRQARERLELAVQSAPQDPLSLKNLAELDVEEERLEEAADLLGRALRADPVFSSARLRLAQLHERRGDPAALMHYFRAIQDAQARGRWLDERSTAPALRADVRHAMRQVASGRRELFMESLAPLRDRHGAAALRRVERCLAAYLGDQPAQSADARQRPSFLYFPDLPPSPYYARERFAWMEVFESRTSAMREELAAVMAQAVGEERVFSDAEEERKGLQGSAGPVTWNGVYFYRHGDRRDENCRRCPGTAAAIDALPDLVRIREHAPEAMFSVLTPGTHILPHRGVTNTRVVFHLPLIVPPGCALRVAGEEHVWREGHGVVFDDTFEHEAWNRGSQTRVVLIVDLWNPDLDAVEREALQELVPTIGRFNRSWQTL